MEPGHRLRQCHGCGLFEARGAGTGAQDRGRSGPAGSGSVPLPGRHLPPHRSRRRDPHPLRCRARRLLPVRVQQTPPGVVSAVGGAPLLQHARHEGTLHCQPRPAGAARGAHGARPRPPGGRAGTRPARRHRAPPANAQARPLGSRAHALPPIRRPATASEPSLIRRVTGPSGCGTYATRFRPSRGDRPGRRPRRSTRSVQASRRARAAPQGGWALAPGVRGPPPSRSPLATGQAACVPARHLRPPRRLLCVRRGNGASLETTVA